MAVAQYIYTAKKKKLRVTLNCSKNGWLDRQGAKKVSFASPRVISTSPKKICDEHWLQFFCNFEFPQRTLFAHRAS